MSTDDPIDDLIQSVTEGIPVDWDHAESLGDSAAARSNLQALQDLERIAEYHRKLQRSPLTASPARGHQGEANPGRIAVQPEQWGDLTLLERASSGASGEVWRAWEAWLQRDVALKFLVTLEGVAAETASESPLLKEARALARVRHPGIVAVHGISAHQGRVGMWMELLTGHNLAEEIERRGRLPPREVLRLGLELCHALQAVEAAGLVHRDIKPANIVLETSGRVVLTDFGLGQRRADLAMGGSARSSGTPYFMAPEILAGEAATPRSDLYALGVSMRWALTGHPPFRARTLEELKLEAAAGPSTPLASEVPEAPAILAAAIERGMAPRAEDRYGSASLLGDDLAKIAATMDGVGMRRRRGLQWWLAWGVALLVLGTAAALYPRLLGRQAPQIPVRFSIAAPPNETLTADAGTFAVSPDGRQVAFGCLDSSGTHRLWVRPFASLQARLLEGTEGGFGPFWSPDSRNLGFFVNKKLKKITLAGGPPETLCDAPDPRGASWGKSGVIVFAPVAVGPLCRVSSAGGEVTQILAPDSTRGETALRWPAFLPDGKHFLFVSLPPRDDNFEVYVAALDSPERRSVLSAGCAPVVAGSEWLVFASNGTLMAQAFDFRRLHAAGEPVDLGQASSADASVGQPLASVSENGVLAQLAPSLAKTELVWRDRKGKRLSVVETQPGRYERTFFSPRGRWILAERRSSPTVLDLWMIEPARKLTTRFSHGPQSRIGGVPVWSPDERRVTFSSNRDGRTCIYQRDANGAGEEEVLLQSDDQFNEVDSWSPDGRFLVFERADPVTGWDLWLLPTEGERKPIPYLRTRFGEIGGRVSPDGKWLAYCSDATGRLEVYVRPFPASGAEHPITSAGGSYVWWTASGSELLVLNPAFDRTVWSVPVSTQPSFEAGRPRLLFRGRRDALWTSAAPDGERFLETVPVEGAEPSTITVDLDWPAQLRR